MLRVLFVGARPREGVALRLKEEVEKIISRVYKAKLTERIQLQDRWAAQFSDLTGWLQDERPDIVHFSGHGTAEAELVFEDELGGAEPVPGEAIVRLLSARLVRKHVRCVVLNACYGAGLAEELRKKIDFVIACPTPISDAAAVAFSEAFYQTLARGECLSDAMELGVAQFLAKRGGGKREVVIGAGSRADARLGVPQLFVREGASAEQWPAGEGSGAGADPAPAPRDRGAPAVGASSSSVEASSPVAAARAPEVRQVRGRASAVSPGPSEAWMVAEGEDRYGRFASFAVGQVVHRLRWIAPGTFVMGSPEGEAGRYPYEGPQHEVELTRGYWLGETPCTQALWQAVMGENPSRFVSPERPVEQVSWDDCQVFLQRLGKLVPGLEARLPTEAEWEHACRAGSSTATWLGDLEIRGKCNAPLLDALAWYAGNSGVGFELGNGDDSSQWPEKQYPHTRAGTHPVGQKPANPWGLHDMLGNVWEWCADGQREYTAARVIDPVGPRTGSNRVIRGGSWYGFAGLVRAALRRAYRPGKRHGGLGFRLARGPSSSPGAEPWPRSGA